MIKANNVIKTIEKIAKDDILYKILQDIKLYGDLLFHVLANKYNCAVPFVAEKYKFLRDVKLIESDIYYPSKYHLTPYGLAMYSLMEFIMD